MDSGTRCCVGDRPLSPLMYAYAAQRLPVRNSVRQQKRYGEQTALPPSSQLIVRSCTPIREQL